jgi:hypothetical protein
MYTEVFHEDTNSESKKQVLSGKAGNLLLGLSLILGVIDRSSSDYSYFDGAEGFLAYILDSLFTGLGIFFLTWVIVTFADYFANRKFFEKHEMAKCAVIAAALAVLFYFAPLNFGHMPKRCPICGRETEGEYIVYNGNRYCLKDGSQILYDDGVYNFYE